jgi:tRNAThr (cytosine32-N3)-methyltransferase
LRNYQDRNYLYNEFPCLHPHARDSAEPVTILETGCGAGNAMLPLLALDPSARVLGCDVSGRAIALVNERLTREALTHRAHAVLWDLTQPPPAHLPTLPFADLALSIFTLSALPPASMANALRHLGACLRPGGRLLIRDYGRLDSKQLKFARAPGARLEGGVAECDWYARGDGTTVVFFSEALLCRLAAAAGLVVETCKLDRRLVVNRATGVRMQRVWIVAVLRREEAAHDCSAAGGGSNSSSSRWPWPPLAVAAAATLLLLGIAAYAPRLWAARAPLSLPRRHGLFAG